MTSPPSHFSHFSSTPLSVSRKVTPRLSSPGRNTYPVNTASEFSQLAVVWTGRGGLGGRSRCRRAPAALRRHAGHLRSAGRPERRQVRQRDGGVGARMSVSTCSRITPSSARRPLPQVLGPVRVAARRGREVLGPQLLPHRPQASGLAASFAAAGARFQRNLALQRSFSSEIACHQF